METKGGVPNWTDGCSCNAQVMELQSVLMCAHLPLAAKGCGVAGSANKSVQAPLTILYTSQASGFPSTRQAPPSHLTTAESGYLVCLDCGDWQQHAFHARHCILYFSTNTQMQSIYMESVFAGESLCISCLGACMRTLRLQGRNGLLVAQASCPKGKL